MFFNLDLHRIMNEHINQINREMSNNALTMPASLIIPATPVVVHCDRELDNTANSAAVADVPMPSVIETATLTDQQAAVSTPSTVMQHVVASPVVTPSIVMQPVVGSPVVTPFTVMPPVVMSYDAALTNVGAESTGQLSNDTSQIMLPPTATHPPIIRLSLDRTALARGSVACSPMARPCVESWQSNRQPSEVPITIENIRRIFNLPRSVLPPANLEGPYTDSMLSSHALQGLNAIYTPERLNEALNAVTMLMSAPFNVPQSAKIAVIKKYTVAFGFSPINVTSDKDTKACAICLSTFDDGEALRRLPCMHFYHIECIEKWLMANQACPICRLHIKSRFSSDSRMEAIAQEEQGTNDYMESDFVDTVRSLLRL